MADLRAKKTKKAAAQKQARRDCSLERMMSKRPMQPRPAAMMLESSVTMHRAAQTNTHTAQCKSDLQARPMWIAVTKTMHTNSWDYFANYKNLLFATF